MLMLALSIISVPSTGLKASQRPHCAQHELAAHHQSYGALENAAVHGHGQQAWEQEQHQCPHCPASECGRASTCTGSSSTAITPTRAVPTDSYVHRVAVDLGLQLPRSSSSPPDTPPPQLIA